MRKSSGGRQKPERREHTGFRPKAELKRRLEASAAAEGRSLSEEIEFRLEQSYGFGGQLTISLGDKWTTARLYGSELLVDVGYDSPQEIAVLEFTDNLEAFKEHFGMRVKK